MATSDFIVNSTTQNFQGLPTVTTLANGRIVMTWTSSDTGDGSGSLVRGRIFDADGDPLGGDFVVNTTVTNNQAGPSVTALSNGGFVVAWSSQETSGAPPDHLGVIRARVFDANGNAAAGDFKVNSTGGNRHGGAVVTALDAGFVVAWQSSDGFSPVEGNVRARLFNNLGTPAADDFIVHPASTLSERGASAATLESGKFVIAWTGVFSEGGSGLSSSIAARLFNANGTPAGNQFLVNTTTQGTQEDPSVAALANGGFVVTWETPDPVPDDGFFETLIRGRVFNANGVAVGADFLVNSTTTKSQSDPYVKALSDGRFVVAWRSTDDGDGSGTLIRARLFNANGTAAGSDFVANTTTQNFQEAPTITELSDGTVLMAWQSYDLGDGSQGTVRARIFDFNNEAPTVAHPIPNKTSPEDVRWTFTVPANTFADADGDALTYTAKLASGAALPSWLTFNAATRTFSGTPLNIFGNFDIKITASDGELSAFDTFRLTITSDGIIDGTPGNDSLKGTAVNDVMQSYAGNDTLNGLGGTDTMRGGFGNDTYVVNVSTDRALEVVNQGIDRVQSAATFTLGANVEHLTLTGTAKINGTGNTLANTIVGNSAVNSLSSGGGNDTLNGMGGSDKLTGGAGRDIFLFSTTPHVSANKDAIADFSVVDDTVRLENGVFTALGTTTGTLAPAKFFIGSAAHDADDRVIYISATGALVYDFNGITPGGAVQFATLAKNLGLTNADFFVV